MNIGVSAKVVLGAKEVFESLRNPSGLNHQAGPLKSVP
jgi:hypothetical protein